MTIKKSRPIQSEKGFTLLEMLVAVTIVAMITVGLWSVFRTSLRAWSRGAVFIDASQRQRTILDMVRKQLASAYPLTAPSDPNSPNPVSPILSNPIFQGTETSLHFISLNSLRFQDSPGLTLVSYEVAQDSGGDYSLVEREARYTGQIFDQDVILNLSESIPIFENLSSCIFEYFEPGNNDNTSQWVRDWNGLDRRRLPVAVSITMISRDPEGNSLNRHIVVPMQVRGTDPFAPGRDIRSNIDESEGALGRRPGYILRERLESERRQ